MNAIDAPVHALGWALLHFLWQGALVGAVAAALLAQLRHARAQARYAVACLALLACLVLPLATLLRGAADTAPTAVAVAFDAGAAAAASGTTPRPTATAADGLREALQPRLPAIVAAWSIGAALLALRMCFGLAWIARLGGPGHGRPHAAWQARLDALAGRMRLSRRVLLRVVDGLDSPVVARALKPIVLVPAALVARMPPDLLEALLAHELAHVRRHDYLVNLAQGAIEALLFYHPVVWWLSRRIRHERELIADDLAAQSLGDRRRVALALDALAALQSRPEPIPTLALAADGGQLMSRIQHLVRPRRPTVQWKAALPVIGISVLCLSFAQARDPAASVAAAVPVATAAPVAVAVPLATTVAAPSAAATAALPGEAARPADRAVVHTVLDGTRDDGDAIRGVHTIADDADADGYALLDAGGGDDGLSYMSGNFDDYRRLRAMRDRFGGEFLWVRRDGREYVTTDAAVLRSVRDAWAGTEPVSRKMEALGAEMERHGAVMERYGRQMEAASAAGEPASREMEALGERMSELGARQAQLAAETARLSHAAAYADDDAERRRAEERLRALEDDQARIEAEMDALGDRMDAHGDALERALAPMEALGAQMERASEPMEALGAQMDVLGEEMERLSERANEATRRAIDAALRDGRMVPLEQVALR